RGAQALCRGRRIFLRPLSPRWRKLRQSAWLCQRGHATRGHRKPGATRRRLRAASVSGQVPDARTANARHRGAWLRDCRFSDEVAEQLREVAINLNVGHLMLLLQFGNMSKELTRYNTQMFSERVMPQLADLFANWEDRWWPRPMAREARARPFPLQSRAVVAE